MQPQVMLEAIRHIVPDMRKRSFQDYLDDIFFYLGHISIGMYSCWDPDEHYYRRNLMDRAQLINKTYHHLAPNFCEATINWVKFSRITELNYDAFKAIIDGCSNEIDKIVSTEKREQHLNEIKECRNDYYI